MRTRIEVERGAVLVMVAVCMSLFFILLAVAIDIGWMHSTKAELQHGADSAALAGALELIKDLPPEDVDSNARDLSVDFAADNKAAYAESQYADPENDVVVGYIDNPLDLSEPITPTITDPNSVQVRTTLQSNTTVGPVPLKLFLGPFTGLDEVSIHTQATATVDDRVIGFDAPDSGEKSGILPFAMYAGSWYEAIDSTIGLPQDIVRTDICADASDEDNYIYNEVTKEVAKVSGTGSGDGLPEVKLYPYSDTVCTEEEWIPGNFGSVDLGALNNSQNDINRQIIEGLDPELDWPYINSLYGGLILHDDGSVTNGTNLTLTVNGDTGVGSSQQAFEDIIGETRIILLYSTRNEEPGGNLDYTIVGWAGVRIMDIVWNTALSKKCIIVQYANVAVEGAKFASDAPHSGSVWVYSLTR